MQFLYNALITKPVTALSHFSKPFQVESDASGTAVGSILT